GKTFYHAGDTALFGDMLTVIGRQNLDIAFLPIGDYYTMGPEDAVIAAHWLEADVVIPMHYNTFPVIKQDVAAFALEVDNKTDSICKIMNPGEIWCLDE
ncbi:MAG: MBL fold metallo-hydrolase, partial [Clostridiales bacterium]